MALPFGVKECIARDISILQVTIDNAMHGWLPNDEVVEKVNLWIDLVGTRKPSLRENRDAAIFKGILLECLQESYHEYSYVDQIILRVRREWPVDVALCPDSRMAAIIRTNYPCDEYADGLAVTGYGLVHREGYRD
jgi:hypothetical protein